MTCLKYAALAVTERGALLAERLYEAWNSDDISVDIYVKKERCPENDLNTAAEIHKFDKMRDLVKDIFYSYDALIFFTSVGIAVRMAAPYVVHKAKDPAVIAVDERAVFAVSLLSGHLGGANELTRKTAAVLNALPVITTATDVNGIPAPDTAAAQLKLVPYPLTHIKLINSALIQNKKVNYYVEENWTKADYYIEKLHQLGIKAAKITARRLNRSYTPCVFLSPQRRIMTGALTLSPRRLIVGIGCRRGVDAALIDKAVKAAVQKADCADMKISKVVSTVVKNSEAGLLEWARANNVRAEFFGNEIMNQTIAKYSIAESAFVKKQIGVGNVCEAAILSYNEKAKIILPKTKFEKVTVSLGWE